jgi:hypothetical protein
MRLFKRELADAITSVELHGIDINSLLDENRNMKSQILKLEAEIMGLSQGLLTPLIIFGVGLTVSREIFEGRPGPTTRQGDTFGGFRH